MNKFHQRSRKFFLIFSVAFVSSCATTTSLPTVVDDDIQHQIYYFPHEFAAGMENANPAQTFVLANSPIGPNAKVHIVKAYFSAAGRPCYDVLIDTVDVSKPMVLCQYSAERWGATRALATKSLQ